jgi:hypothetical protein
MTLHLPRALRRAATGVALALASVLPVAAAPLSYLSLEELALRSEACVLGRVVDARTHWNEDRTVIVTTFTLDVEEPLAGRASTGPLVLHRVGGELEGLRLGYSGMPELEVGDRAVVFLREAAPEAWIVSGLRQGVLQEQDGLLERDLRGVLGAPAPRERLGLDSLRERVRAAVGAAP